MRSEHLLDDFALHYVALQEEKMYCRKTDWIGILEVLKICDFLSLELIQSFFPYYLQSKTCFHLLCNTRQISFAKSFQLCSPADYSLLPSVGRM